MLYIYLLLYLLIELFGESNCQFVRSEKKWQKIDGRSDMAFRDRTNYVIPLAPLGFFDPLQGDYSQFYPQDYRAPWSKRPNPPYPDWANQDPTPEHEAVTSFISFYNKLLNDNNKLINNKFSLLNTAQRYGPDGPVLRLPYRPRTREINRRRLVPNFKFNSNLIGPGRNALGQMSYRKVVWQAANDNKSGNIKQSVLKYAPPRVEQEAFIQENEKMSTCINCHYTNY